MFDDLDPLTCSPGELLSRLLAIDPSTLDGDSAVTYLQVLDRALSHLHAVQAAALVAAASHERMVDEYTVLIGDSHPFPEQERTMRIEDAVREEVAAALRWSSSHAQSMIDSARLLVGPLSCTFDALKAGDISPGHVRVIVAAAGRLPGWQQHNDDARTAFAAACQELQRRVLPVARRAALSGTRAAANRAVLVIDAEGARRRREDARCTRDVLVYDEVDGLSTLWARMATEQAHALMTQIDAFAHADTPDFAPDLTMGERRAEALAAMVLGGDGATAAPVLAHLDVTVDLTTLLGLADAVDPESEVAQIRGADPVIGDVVRDLLADPSVAVTMRRLITAPVDGHLLDYGRQTYEVPKRLRDFIVARDRACRFPGCNRRSDLTQIDHAIAWDDGGATNPANLGALCVRHHQLKTHGGWEILESRADGSCRWKSPHGRIYDHDPPTD